MSLYWWAFGEVNYKRYVGAHTPTERLVHPLEVSAGIQYNVPWFPAVAVGAAYQRLLNRAGHGDPRTSSLLTADGTVGDINFSPGVDPDLATEVASYLTERGVAFSDRSSRVLSTNNPAFDAWRNIPAEPGTIRAEGPQNILGFMTWRIGSIR
jgi:hypothetical protein